MHFCPCFLTAIGISIAVYPLLEIIRIFHKFVDRIDKSVSCLILFLAYIWVPVVNKFSFNIKYSALSQTEVIMKLL